MSDTSTEIPPGMHFAVTLDLEGRIDALTAGMARLIGCDAGEVTGDYIESLAHADVPAALFVDLWRDLRAGRPWSGVIKIQSRHGVSRWARMVVVPARTHGRVVSYIATFERALSREIDAAKLAYRHITEAGDGSDFEHGSFVSGTLGERIGRKLRAVSLRARLAYGAALALIPSVLVAVLGVSLLADGDAGSASRALTVVVVSMLATVLAGVVWWRLERRLTVGLRVVDTSMARMADGDFVAPIDCRRDDEVGRVLHSLAMLQVRLRFDMQCDDEPLRRAHAPDSPTHADARADALGRWAARLVAEAEKLVSGSEGQRRSVDRMTAIAHVMGESGTGHEVAYGEGQGVESARCALNTLSSELDAIGQALAPTSALLSDAELLAFELKLLALNFALAHGRDERAALPLLENDVRERAHDAGRAFERLRDMVNELGARLAQTRSALSGAGEALVAPQTTSSQGVAHGLLPSLGELEGELHDMVATVRSNRAVADRIVLLASDLEAMLQAHAGDTSGPSGTSTANTDDSARAEGAASFEASALPLRSGRTSAKISRLRPPRHEVGAPVPRVRRAAVRGSSIEDEWGSLHE